MLLLIAATSAIIGVACSKQSQSDKKVKELSITFDNKTTTQTEKVNSTCPTGAISATYTVILSTCASSCGSGIGFKCDGGYWTFTYAMGRSCQQQDKMRCVIIPPPLVPTNSVTSNRIATTYKLIFYNNGTMKYLFLSPLPEEEKNNNICEIEYPDICDLPSSMLIQGVRYKGYLPAVGKYIINRNDGKYGSVTFPVVLMR